MDKDPRADLSLFVTKWFPAPQALCIQKAPHLWELTSTQKLDSCMCVTGLVSDVL